MSLNVTGTRVEFYRDGTSEVIATLSGVGAIPREGEFISIRQATWRVVRVAWAVDHAGEVGMSELRANIDLSPNLAPLGTKEIGE